MLAIIGVFAIIALISAVFYLCIRAQPKATEPVHTVKSETVETVIEPVQVVPGTLNTEIVETLVFP